MNKRQSEFFEFGEIVKTRGLRGCLKVLCYTEAARDFMALKKVFLSASAEKDVFTVKKIQSCGKFLFIELQEINCYDEAKRLVGRKIYLPKSVLKKPQDGEYYWHDIIGLEVFTEDEKLLGEIVSIIPTGSNDVYVCRKGKKELLLPAISDVILKIDLPKGRLTVRVSKGL